MDHSAGSPPSAAAVAVRYPAFKGWYRLTAGRYDRTQHRVTLTVHPRKASPPVSRSK